MAIGRLTDLQERVLTLLAGMEPQWTLTGGGALAGFHLKHRTTMDLDLFWHGRSELGPEKDEVTRRLTAAGLMVEVIQSSPGFRRLRVRQGDDMVVVDLVAEPVATVEHPRLLPCADRQILVDTPHEILTNKVCTILSRAEIRDLQDLQALLAAGGDLDRALRDAPRKDGGYSALTLVWLLRSLDVPRLSALANLPPETAASLARFRDELVERVARMTGP
jgi:hypothetical protein